MDPAFVEHFQAHRIGQNVDFAGAIGVCPREILGRPFRSGNNRRRRAKDLAIMSDVGPVGQSLQGGHILAGQTRGAVNRNDGRSLFHPPQAAIGGGLRVEVDQVKLSVPPFAVPDPPRR